MTDDAIDYGGSVDTAQFAASGTQFFVLPSLEPGAYVVPAGDPPPAGVDRTRQAVSGGPRSGLFTLAKPPLVPNLEALHRQYGDQVYDWMLLEPKVGASVDTIRQAVLSDDIQLTQSVPFPETEEGAKPDPVEQADAEESAEWAKFCGRATVGVHGLLPAVYDLMLAMAYRCKVGELTWRYGDGADREKLYLDTLRVLPRRVWYFAVDDYNDVVGIVGRAAEVERDGVTEPSNTRVFPREKFVVMSWFPRDHDPRGTTVLDRAYSAYNFKLKLWPKFNDYVDQFANPSLVGTVGENAKPRRLRLTGDAPGRETGDLVQPEYELNQTLLAFRGSNVIALPHGYGVTPLEVAGTGEAHQRAFDITDREIVFAIMQTTRATMEAEHGSKADSATAQDLFGLLVRMTKLFVAGVLKRDIFYTTVLLNGGREAANRFTPDVQLGHVEHHDFAQSANAVANLRNAGMVPDSLVPKLLKWLGAPALNPGVEYVLPKPQQNAEKVTPATAQPLQKPQK